MSEDDFDNPTPGYTKAIHQQSQPYQSWCPTGATAMQSAISQQEFYFETNVKNIDNIHKITLDSQYREICPVWKPALPGTRSIFGNE